MTSFGRVEGRRIRPTAREPPSRLPAVNVNGTNMSCGPAAAWRRSERAATRCSRRRDAHQADPASRPANFSDASVSHVRARRRCLRRGRHGARRATRAAVESHEQLSVAALISDPSAPVRS